MKGRSPFSPPFLGRPLALYGGCGKKKPHHHQRQQQQQPGLLCLCSLPPLRLVGGQGQGLEWKDDGLAMNLPPNWFLEAILLRSSSDNNTAL